MKMKTSSLLCAVAACTFAVGSADVADAASPTSIYMYDIQQGNNPDRQLMASLTGLVARNSAEVAMGKKNVDDNYDPEFWVDQYISNNPGTSKQWQSNIEWFIDRYKSDFNGYVVYNASSLNQGTSAAGALGALMVDESLLGGSIGSALSSAGLSQLEDVRGRSESWVYNKYQNQFNKDKIFRQRADLSHEIRSLAVKEGGFVFNDTGAQRDTYLANQNDHSIIYGWGFNNNEQEFFGSASQNNLMAVPADFLQPTASLSEWDVNIGSQPHKTATDIQTEAGKHYVAFVMSDGDNAQWLTNDFARSNKWFGSDHRGDFDMTFDLAPDLINVNPTALKYFYDEAAGDANKTHFVTAGGQGFNYPSETPDIAGFMDATVAAMGQVDHNVISVLDDTPNYDKLKEMVEREEVLGLMLKTGAAYAANDGSIIWHDGKPIVSVKHTLWDNFDTPNSIINDLNTAPTDSLTNQGSYTIVNVHPWSNHNLDGGQGDPMSSVDYIVNNLDADVNVVTLDELMIHLTNNFGDATLGPATNLVFNGDFETGGGSPDGWFTGSGTSYVSGDDSDGNGNFAVSISQPGSDWRSQEFDVFETGLMQFVFDVKFDPSVADGTGIRADARFFSGNQDSGGTFVGEGVIFVDAANYSDNTWHRISLDVVVPEGTAVGDIRFSTIFGPFTGGNVYIDNVQFLTSGTTIPTPSALGLAVIGIGASTLRRRRRSVSKAS